MADYLVFRLYGPMASWGDIAVGEVRPSYTHPSKSAILGIVAAALGIKREEEGKHRELTSGYSLAVRVDSMSIPLVDYHTVQVPPSGKGRKRLTFATRKDELCTLPKEDLNTILSRRDYRMDAISVAVLWARVAEPPFSLQEIQRAMECPEYVLYLGRKSCPLALPLEAQVIPADSPREALVKACFKSELDVLSLLRPLDHPSLYWDEGADVDLDAEHIYERRDVPLSRRRWQFGVRRECQATLSREE